MAKSQIFAKAFSIKRENMSVAHGAKCQSNVPQR